MAARPRFTSTAAVTPSRVRILGLCAIVGSLLCTGLAGGQAMADQKDPRLTALFEGLAAAKSVFEAAPIEQRIWQLWGDATTTR